ncbi:hypothetical protein ACOI1H_20185, partial [Loktanella sp. DJP18]|uniref:hypothetical protein n=1 Tax=Loktanella sp. DJP18 TaxID=3409788 RepID=UPI003BB7EDD4
MYSQRGTPAQEHLRALCGYIAIPLAMSRTSVLGEAMRHVPACPADALTLEIVISAADFDLLKHAEDCLGDDLYHLPKIEDHGIWRKVYTANMSSDMRAHFARRALSLNPLTNESFGKLTHTAVGNENM